MDSRLRKQTRNLIKLGHTVSGGAKLPKQINYYFLVFSLAIQMAHSHCYICVCVRPERHAFLYLKPDYHGQSVILNLPHTQNNIIQTAEQHTLTNVQYSRLSLCATAPLSLQVSKH